MATLEHQRPGIKERGFVAKINFALFHDCWELTRAPLIGHFAKTIKHGDCLRYGFRNGTARHTVTLPSREIRHAVRRSQIKSNDSRKRRAARSSIGRARTTR